MGVTDHQLLALETREHAIHELAAAATIRDGSKVSARVAIARSPHGEWRVVHRESDLGEDAVAVAFQVFRGETVEPAALIDRVVWATREVRRLVTARRDR